MGVLLIVFGRADAVLGWFVVAPLVPDPAKKKIILGSMLFSAVAVTTAGCAFLLGVFEI